MNSFNTYIDEIVLLSVLNPWWGKDSPAGHCILCVQRVLVKYHIRKYLVNEVKPIHPSVKCSLVGKALFWNLENVILGFILS